MKKNVLLMWLLGILICPFVLTSCNDENEDVIWDFAPINLDIYVQDAEGNNLLDPLAESSLLGQNIKAIYQGKEYKLNEVPPRTRYYLPNFQGLQLTADHMGIYHLSFGELGGDERFDNVDITIDWGDGTRDVITLYNSLEWNDNDPDATRRFYLNGAEQESSMFRITKSSMASPSISQAYWNIVETYYGIEAENKEEIEQHLKSHSPYPIGSSYHFDFPDNVISNGDKGTITWKDPEGVTTEGVLTFVEGIGFDGFNQIITDKYQAYPPDDQIYYYMRWRADLADGQHFYDVFSVRSSSFYYQRLWLYEDLTETYQALYPEQAVEQVVRVSISELNSEQ